MAIGKNANSQVSYYVKQSATGLNNGSSWANAFTSLSTAFSLITNKDTIRVAKGVYTPGTNALNSFQLKDSVMIMGGYPDTGNPTDGDRDFGNYQSIMSGEIGVPNNPLDNIKIILQAVNVKGFVVDGFIIEKGYSEDVPEYGPVYFNGVAGGIIDHAVIRNNFNYWGGAAINAINSTATLSNSFIENNTTVLSNDGSVFKFSSQSNITLVNIVVAKNKTTYVLNQAYSTVKLLNATVFKNYGFSTIHDTSSLIVQNSIFYRNANNYYVDTAEFIKDVYSTISISNTITEVYNTSGPGFLGADPKFTDTTNVAGADGKYFTADDGLRLLNPCSPAINAGNNSFVNGINSDIAGATRIKNGIVDLGAYEVQEAIGSIPSVIYVKKNATGLNNGTSWQDAFTDLQSAFKSCSDTIKVAKGIYPVSASDPSASFILNNHRVIMGGYPDFGSPTNNDINTELYPSVLDGMISSTSKCYTVVLANNTDSTARMIGFEIMNSAPPLYNPYYSPMGTIKVSYKSAPYFEKIKVNSVSNQAAYLLYVTDQSKPVFYNCAFYNGFISAGSNDGARTISIRKNSEPKFLSSYFGKDTTTATFPNIGGSMVFDNSGGMIDGCSFYLNNQSVILNRNSSYTRIQNSLFRRTNGTSIFNDHSIPVISNCIFRDTVNNSSNGGGAVYNYNNSDVQIDKCRFFNLYIWNGGAAVKNLASSVTIKNSLFRNCRSDRDGSVLKNDAGKITVINCMGYMNGSDGNQAVASGTFAMGFNNSATTIINSTIISAALGSPVLQSWTSSDTIRLYNSIIWRYVVFGLDLLNGHMANSANDVSSSNNNNSALCDIRNSILYKQPNTLLTNSTTGINPKFLDLTKPEGADNVYYSADDGLTLCTCSPAINAGDNSLNPEVSDINGANRIYGGTVDVGAYELQTNPTTTKTFFVKENAATGGNGESWSGAYNSLQKAVLNNCADTIKIAKGTYKPAVSNRDSAFNVYRGVALLGGYPDAGNPGDVDRDILANPTILSGDIGVLNDSLDNSMNIMRIYCLDTTVLVDGIIFERGNANVQSIFAQSRKTMQGGGIYAMGNKRLLINRCTFRNNFAFYGGGMYSSTSTLDINKTEFSNNNAQLGGGLHCDARTGAAPFYFNGPSLFVRNSVFNGNKGGGVYAEASGSSTNANFYSFENLVFYKNEGAQGAGFMFNGQIPSSFTNCIFAKNNNSTPLPGAGIYVYTTNSSLTLFTSVFNTIFTGNTVLGANPSSYVNPDLNWRNTSAQPTATIPFANLRYSAISPNQTQTSPTVTGNISNTGVTLSDINNGTGPDLLWMTPDDGVRPLACSNTMNKGNNTYVTNIPVDILDSTRIQNSIVDMGPYELGGTVPANPVATITATDTTICPGTQVTFTAVVTGANASTSYQWMINSIPAGTNSATFVANTLANNDTVKVVITINSSCVTTQTVTSNSIVIHVHPTLTASVTISASTNPSCIGRQVIYTATPVNAGATATYQWKRNGVNAGTNSTTYIPTTLVNNDVISLVMTSSLGCVTSNPVTSNSITQTVTSLVSTSVSITASPIGCAGSPITFTPVPVNGGTAPGYQWHVNGTYVAFGPTFTSSTLNENDVVLVVMISNAPCALSTPAVSPGYHVHYSPGSVIASVSITATTIGCPGSSITFTANPVNGGTAPVYQWKVNGSNAGTNSPTFISSSLNENDVVTVVMTSNSSCVATAVVSSPPLVVHYTGSITASVTVTSAAIGCPGTSITFTANPVNGGTIPLYQWKVNGVNAGTNSSTFTSSALIENDVITVVMTSNEACVAVPVVTSPPFVVHFSASVTASVGITSSAIGCAGSSISFTANPVNGGTAPSYQWKVNGGNVGTNSPGFISSALIENDVVTVEMTSNAACVAVAVVTSIPFVVHFTAPVTASVGITSTAIGCAGSSITFTANPVNGGTAPSYQWKVNGTNVGTNSPAFISSTLSENDVVTVEMTSNAACVTTPVVTSLPFIVHYATSVTASVSVTSTAIGCTGSPVTFNANPVNGGTAPSYQWKVNGANVGTSSPAFTSSTLNENDVVTVVMTSNATCVVTPVVTSPSLVVHYIPSVTASVGIISSAIGCVGTSITFTANPVNGGTAASYQWKVNGTNVGTNSTTFTSPALSENDVVTVVMTSNATCVLTPVVTSPAFVVHFSAATIASVSITANTSGICQGTPVTFNAIPVNPGTAPSYQWQLNGINVGTNNIVYSAANLANNDQVKVIMSGPAGCGPAYTAGSNTVTMQVQQLAVPVIALSGQGLAVSNPDAAATYSWQVLTNGNWADVIPAATGITYTVAKAGTYRVRSVKGFCTTYSASQAATVVSPRSLIIRLYPNPGHNYIILDSIRLERRWKQVDIIDAIGRQVLPSVNIANLVSVTIDITILPPGTYIAVIRQQDGVQVTKKFVKL